MEKLIGAVILVLIVGWVCDFGGGSETSEQTGQVQASEPERSYQYEASTSEGKIERAISDFATAKEIRVDKHTDYTVVMYSQTFSAWDDQHVKNKTKEYMHKALKAAYKHGTNQVRLAPYYPSDSGDDMPVALFTVYESDYTEGKDLEYYSDFHWK